MNKEQLVAELMKFDTEKIHFLTPPWAIVFESFNENDWINIFYAEQIENESEIDSEIIKVDLVIKSVGILKDDNEYSIHFDRNEFNEKLVERGYTTHEEIKEKRERLMKDFDSGKVFSDVMAVE